MKGSEAKLVSYMQGSDKRFVIPVYQRNYDWRIENCKQLYDDLIAIIRKGRSSHFFGSIVSVHSDGEFNEYLIIDGQQRLTTISLLMLAMYNLMKSGTITPTQSNLADKIYKTYLIDEWQEEDTRIKLKPVKNDSTAFGRLFKDTEDYIQGSNLTVNYNYFYSRIQKEEISIDELYAAITKLEIINITLNKDDNPQLIFESLNSTGLALSEGDKIRNFILMGLPSKEQNDYYEKYWNKIELCTNYDVSSFMRDYLSVKQQAIPSISRVYVTFKTYVEENKIETEDLLKDLLDYAKWYEILIKARTEDKKLNACIYRLNRLETTITRPFFLEVLRMMAKGSPALSLQNVREVFLLTENYLFRRSICDLPTNALNKIFLMLHREIIRFDGTEADYLEKFKYALLSKPERGRFPKDDEFAEAMGTRQIYPMNIKNKAYIFERFENYGIDEDKDIYRHLDEGTYSIEHIMPQHLTPQWVSALGDDYEDIHETWLHRLANLTLTAYNSKYSNNSFADKRDMDKGFRYSGLRMNTWIANQEKWTLAELEERRELLVSRALNIWPMPVTSYQPAEKQLDSYTLEDDVDLSGREIVRFGYKNTEQPVDSWITMMVQILKILHAEDKSVMALLAHTDNPDDELNDYISDNPADLRGALEIDQDIYLERNTSTSTKLSILRKFFKAYGQNPEELVFYLKDQNTDQKAEEAGTRFELRRRYWAFALEHIKTAHGPEGSFKNVTTSKQYWINGSIGISGFSIVCEAKMNRASVELVLGKSNRDVNKSAYDYLFARKDEIEAALGIPLNWWRFEGKSSYVDYNIAGVGISDETSWTQMAKFHAEWSKKFYDVFVPLLQQWNAMR
jgi:uncharacterized protein with ParB-like and HNH nuclease domain